mmetsp:Transcript_932/g.2665  ORF Transcript_932/g.2665 Transcript_932/m.2665 type:complete len:306 (-) Transcript_932:662-1579(-)
MADTLSREPRSCMAAATRASAACWGSPWSSSWALTKATVSALVMRSKRPSEARTQKASSGARSRQRISGSAITRPPARSCSSSDVVSGGSPRGFSEEEEEEDDPKEGRSSVGRRRRRRPEDDAEDDAEEGLTWSARALFKPTLPKARETASSPRTRLRKTQPPALRMRAASSARVGRWSKESGTALEPRQSTARESPTLAQCRVEPRNRTRMAVLPADGADEVRRNSASVARKARVRARGTSSSSSSSSRRTARCSCAFRKTAASSPPWPSYTAANVVVCRPRRSWTRRERSSMVARQPLDSERP